MAATDEVKLDFNCYLIRSGVTEPQSILREEYRRAGKEALVPIEGAQALPLGAIALLNSKRGGGPAWARKLKSLLPPLADLTSVSHKLLIFLPVDGRLFALCFGYARNALDWSAVEYNFGLRVAARSMAPGLMRELRTRRVDVTARTQQVSVARGGSFRELDVEIDGEFVSRLVGSMSDENEFDQQAVDLGIDTKGVIVASDSIRFRAANDFEGVQRTLSRLLQLVEERSAQREFEFIDALEPLKGSDSRVALLESVVGQQIFGESITGDTSFGRTALVALAPPDSISIADVIYIRLSKGKSISGDIENFDFDSVMEALASWRDSYSSSDLKTIKVTSFGSNDEPIGPSYPLMQWLVAEVVDEDRRYVLTMGKWFALVADFIDRLDRDLSILDDVTEELDLPSWKRTKPMGKGSDTGYDEGDYNRAVAAGSSDWACLDKVDLRSGGFEIEVCDLLHKSGHLVHVKRWAGSQTMSAQFAQGSVSVEVLRGDADYKAAFLEYVSRHTSGFAAAAAEAPAVVVFAVGVRGGYQIPHDLPTFSKVNLRQHCRKIRAMGARPAIARVQMV